MRVVVAMSGGVDSSVVAALLHLEGHQVIGLTMKTWSYAHKGPVRKETGCCNLDSIQDARSIAVRLGFPHYILDLQEEFGQAVIDHFIEEYRRGRTPNPCILCNTYIKWDALLRRADKLGAEKIATGHYARIGYEGGRYFIRRGVDRAKDQSYVLWGLSQEVLGRTLFPLGEKTKTEIRALAEKWGFRRVAHKKDSYEICFIPEGDYRAFLLEKDPTIQKLEGGPIYTVEGKKVGTHRGYPFYTIGQRRGLPALGEAHYVVEIRPETNTLIIGRLSDLEKVRFRVREVQWQKLPTLPTSPFPATIQIRSMDVGHEGNLYLVDKNTLDVEFFQPVRAITPGQAAVFYQGESVLAGGWIEKVL